MSKKYSKIALSVATMIGCYAMSNTAFADQAKSVSLGQAIMQLEQTPQTGNPKIQALISQQKADEQGIKIAKGAYLPTLDVSAGWGYAYSKLGSQPFKKPYVNGQADQANATLTQLVFDGFGTPNRINFNEDKAMASQYKIDEGRESEALTAAKDYLDVVRLNQLSQNAKENVKTHESIANNIPADQKNKAEDIANSRLEQAKNSEITAQGAARNAKTAYDSLFLMANPPKPDNNITPAQLQAQLDAGIAKTPDLENVFSPNAVNKPDQIESLISQNPAFQADTSTLASTYKAIKVAKSAYYPVITLQASANTGRNVNGLQGDWEGRQSYLQGMILANWNLFNGFRDQASVAQARENENTAQNNLNSTDLDVKKTILQAYNNWNTTRESIRTLEKRVQRSKSAATQSRALFGNGDTTVSALNVLDTVNEAYNAKNELLNAQYQELVDQYTLLAAMGKLTTVLKNTA